MKHEIEIQDLPDGWEAVAYRVPEEGEYYFGSRGVKLAQIDFENLWLVVRKKQPRRIVLEESEQTNKINTSTGVYLAQRINSRELSLDMHNQRKLWKIVGDNKCAE